MSRGFRSVRQSQRHASDCVTLHEVGGQEVGIQRGRTSSGTGTSRRELQIKLSKRLSAAMLTTDDLVQGGEVEWWRERETDNGGGPRSEEYRPITG